MATTRGGAEDREGAEGGPKEVTRNDKGWILNPWTCLAVKNEKYAKDCVEVYLCGKGANQISPEFRRFPSVEVLWFNHNKLTRFHNLETNFRVREVYIEQNRLVSLKGLLTFKFLKVLLARGNQLRNLDKQIGVLSNFNFLKRLDLSDNAVADEPDYLLRVIYNLPQVEDLDRTSVKQHQRIRAAEVVPNLDSVTEKPAVHVKYVSPSQQFSEMEKHCFKEARDLRLRYKREEEEEKKKRYAATANWLELYGPKHLPTEAWQNARAHEVSHLSAWEMAELNFFLFQRYILEKEPDEIIANTLAKTRQIGEVMNVDGPRPTVKETKAKDGTVTMEWEETAKMKEDKARVKGEVQKMKEKMLNYDALLDLLEVLMDGDVVKLGRILRDECADPLLSLVDVAARVFENSLFLEAPTILEVAKTLGIKVLPDQWGSDERFGSSKEQIDKLVRLEPYKKLLSTAQKALLREHFIFFKKHGEILYMVDELSKEEKADLTKEELQKRAFWAPFLEDQDSATASLHDLFKWLVTLTWAWEEDAVLDKRMKTLEKRTKMAHLQDQHAEALCLSQMMNRMDGVKTRKRELLLAKRTKEDRGDVRVDYLPLITFDKKTVVDAVSGRTSVAFVRTKSEFRFPTCR